MTGNGLRKNNHLQPLYFDELLDPVHQVEEAVLVIVSGVSAPQPARLVKRLLVGLLVVAVAEHDLGTLHHDLTHFVWTLRLVCLYIPDLGRYNHGCRTM